MYINHQKQQNCHYLTISRPERMNALGSKLASELRNHLQHIARQADDLPIALVVQAVTSKDQKIGIAGGDLKELAALDSTAAGQYCADMSWCCEFLASSSRPALIFCAGSLIGGGAELALACDIRIGTSATDFIFKQMHVGLATGYGSAERMVRLLGLARSQKLLFSQPRLPAATAEELGILHKLYNDAVSMIAAIPEHITQVGRYGSQAWQAQKKMLNQAVNPNQVSAENAAFLAIWRNPTHDQFLKTFMRREQLRGD